MEMESADSDASARRAVPAAAASSGSNVHPSIQGLQSRSNNLHFPTAPSDSAASTRDAGNKASTPAMDDDVPPLETEGNSRFICNICLNSPDKPVATVCGHMYCWKCLYKWLDMHRDEPQCPVCKAGIEMPGGDPSKAKVVPLYVSEKDTDPRQTVPEDPSIPQRPPGERPEPQRNAAFAQHGWQGGFGPGGFGYTHQFGNINVTAGFGLFPSLFGMAFSPTWPSGAHAPGSGAAARGPQPPPGAEGMGPGGVPAQGMGAGGAGQVGSEREEAAQQEFLSRLLFMIGTFIALCLIFFP